MLFYFLLTLYARAPECCDGFPKQYATTSALRRYTCYLQFFKIFLQQPYHPGGLASLLSIAMEPSADLAVRQVAAIAVKNAIRKGWSLKGEI